MRKRNKAPLKPYLYLRDRGRGTPKLLEYLHNGGTDIETINELCDEGLTTIAERYDCSDFRIGIFVRVLYSFSHVIGPELEKRIHDVLCDFPFEETSGNSMCTWTENHQLIFAGNGYLFGCLFPDDTMYGGISGKELASRCEKRIDEWCEFVFRFGFSEYGSCNYYPETFAALGNLIQFSPSDSIKNKCKMVCDLLLLDVFSSTTPDGTYNKATARAYFDNKINFRNYMDPHIQSLLGQDIRVFRAREACFILMLKDKDEDGAPYYVLPKAIKNLFEKPERVIKESNGLEISEYKEKGLLEETDANVRYALTGGAFTDKKLVRIICRYFDKCQMWQNAMIASLEKFRTLAKACPSLFCLLQKIFAPAAADMGFGRGNVYTYVHNRYSMSSLQKYHLGLGAFQQCTNIVNIDGLGVFANCPSKEMTKGGSPNYWVGGARNPHVCQFKNTMLMVFPCDKARGFGKGRTHVFFPTSSFDEIDESHLRNGYIFARYHGINIMVKSNLGIHFVPSDSDRVMQDDPKLFGATYERYDLMNEAKGKHYYVFLVDDSASLKDFVKQCLEIETSFKGKTLKFGSMSLTYGKCGYIDGVAIDSAFHRFEGDYIQGGFYDYDKNKPLVIREGDDELILDFKNCTRVDD